ncbi:alpha/beta hydrolase [Granulicoccus sp. GXG6511]|uniref:alpha/beta hydrolase n=1 Tax=Granulicoccus sp. GXG6511 TaxID=3381351 RepID=UPI003D7D239A
MSDQPSNDQPTPLAPEAAEVLAAAPRRPERHLLSIEENRAAMRATSTAFGAGAEIDRVENTTFPGRDGAIPVRIYRTASGSQPVLVYAHGGGWVLGDLDTHDAICRNLAALADCAVVSVDYRQPPEHKFPAAPHDVIDVVQHVLDHAEKFDFDPGRIAVGGDSAGGNLAAVAAQHLRIHPGLVHQLLLIPTLDTHLDQWPSQREFATVYNLTRNDLDWYFNHYFGDTDTSPDDPLLAPYQARDLTGLPSATIVTAECDPLRDEAEAYAARLEQSGVDIGLRRFDGMFHPFILFGGSLAAAREAQEYAAAELRKAFDRAAPR